MQQLLCDQSEQSMLFQSAMLLKVDFGNKGSTITPKYVIPADLPDTFVSTCGEFAFPDLKNLTPHRPLDTKTFIFTLTDVQGRRSYGYCRRLVKKGADASPPFCVVLVSTVNSLHLYNQLLDLIEAKVTGGSLGSAFPLLRAASTVALPTPGEHFLVRVSRNELYEILHPPNRDNLLESLENVPILDSLSAYSIVRIFASLLKERRIIFCASTLSILSQGVQALVALLYPFSWQHIFIPVLPDSLLSYCCAPMPFIIGVLTKQLPEVMEMKGAMEDVIVFDLDADVFIEEPNSEDLALLPVHYVSSLINSVRKAKRRAHFEPAKYRWKGKLLAKPFLAFFVQLMWNYRRFISDSVGPDRVVRKGQFDPQGFLNSKKTKSTRHFLQQFMQTQMWNEFVSDYEMQRPNQLGTFERMTSTVCISFSELQAALEKENSKPLRRMQRAISGKRFKSRYFKGSADTLHTPPRMLANAAAAKEIRTPESPVALSIIKKHSHVSGFRGLPLSTMRKRRLQKRRSFDRRAFFEKLGSEKGQHPLRMTAESRSSSAAALLQGDSKAGAAGNDDDSFPSEISSFEIHSPLRSPGHSPVLMSPPDCQKAAPTHHSEASGSDASSASNDSSATRRLELSSAVSPSLSVQHSDPYLARFLHSSHTALSSQERDSLLSSEIEEALEAARSSPLGASHSASLDPDMQSPPPLDRSQHWAVNSTIPISEFSLLCATEDAVESPDTSVHLQAPMQLLPSSSNEPSIISCSLEEEDADTIATNTMSPSPILMRQMHSFEIDEEQLIAHLMAEQETSEDSEMAALTPSQQQQQHSRIVLQCSSVEAEQSSDEL